MSMNFSNANPAELKAYLLTNEAALAGLGQMGIDALDMAGIQKAFIDYDIDNVGSWANADYISNITTPTSNRIQGGKLP